MYIHGQYNGDDYPYDYDDKDNADIGLLMAINGRIQRHSTAHIAFSIETAPHSGNTSTSGTYTRRQFSVTLHHRART